MEKLELNINKSKKIKIANSESANRSSPIIAQSQEIREEASGSQYEDEDTVENKNYIDVLKKYFGYKSFRP